MDTVLRGPFGPILLGANVVTIGRTPDNQVVVNDPQAFSRHAEIYLTSQGYVIADVGSATGTFVNGQRLDWNVPRLLNNGDSIRIGNTTFGYEASAMAPYQGPPSSPGYEPTVVAAPSTSYGPGEYQSYPPSSSSPYAYIQSLPQSYTPPPPSYGAPQPPPYGAPAQPGYTAPGEIRYLPPNKAAAKKRSNVGLIVSIAFAVLVILGSAGIFFVVRNNQIATQNADATATANARAAAAATATFVADPYGHGTFTFFDPMTDNSKGHLWDQGSSSIASCQFSRGSYHVTESETNKFNFCAGKATNFSNFTFQADMKIVNGDCGAVIFRADSTNNRLYWFEICRNGTYDVAIFTGSSGKYLVNHTSSSLIKTGSGDTNVITVVANGSTLQGYVNNTSVGSLVDSTFTQGEIGFQADDYSKATEVAFSNVKVWTM